MKHNYLIAILFMALLTSCSTSDDSASTEQTTENDYFPVGNGKFWVYDVQGEYPGRDSLYIASDTTINNTAHKKFKTKEVPFGFYSSSLANNGIRKSGDKLLVSGSTGVDLIEGFPIDLAVTDFVLFKENASDNEQLSSVSGTLNYQYEEFPLTFKYTMKSVFATTLPTFTVPGKGTYENVKVMKVVVNLSIESVYVSGPITLPLTILPAQDVVVSTQYYVNTIGMVYSNTDINYTLANEDISVGVPTSGSQNIKEYLVDYSE